MRRVEARRERGLERCAQEGFASGCQLGQQQRAELAWRQGRRCPEQRGIQAEGGQRNRKVPGRLRSGDVGSNNRNQEKETGSTKEKVVRRARRKSRRVRGKEDERPTKGISCYCCILPVAH
eukprot:6187915-Pleurochrysis_carterae.AAC.1